MTPSLSTPLECAQSLVPDILSSADAIDKGREIPSDLVFKIKQNNLLRLLVPKSMGGEEMDWRKFLDVVFTIAYADGSVGWCINQGCVFATNSARKPRNVTEKIWSDKFSSVGNGPPSNVVSNRTNGGYLLSGTWRFSSGCRHATWLAALAGGDANGPPRLHFLPRDDIKLVDVWQVQGLRGTGSFSFSTKDYFVPDDQVLPLNQGIYEPNPLYVVPQSLMFACGFGTVALGVARSGLDGVLELAQSKKPQFGGLTLAKDPVIQSKIGVAEGKWRGAKALLFSTVEEVWQSVQEKSAITLEERVNLRLVGTHAIRESAAVVDIVYNLSGSTAIFESTQIQRKFQDIHVITQQVQGREAHYQAVGSFVLGQEIEGGIL